MKPHRLAPGRLLALYAAVALMTFGLVSLSPADAHAADSSGQLLLLMDSSGSMAGSDGAGSTKINAAKRAIIGVVGSSSPSDRLGLRVYGADKSPNDPAACHDTRLLVPVGPVNKGKVAAAATLMRPRGQTPIAYSLQRSAKDFHGDTPRTILLVSDGIETCNPNPCAVARQVEAAGIDLRIDVVGFRVDEKAQEQLQCIASAGHGTYTDVKDGPSLETTVNRDAVRALRHYRPAGTPIDGALNNPIGAPLITPGQHLDSVPLNPESTGKPKFKFYVFDRLPKETVHFSVTIVPPISVINRLSEINAVGLQIFTENGTQCAFARGQTTAKGVPSSTAITLGSDNGNEDCNRAGRFRLAVLARTNGERAVSLPLELIMLTEPNVTNLASLPAGTGGERAHELPAPAGAGAKVAGGASFADAPTLDSGATYHDTIRPGETLLYRVKVDWGQQLDWRLDFPALTGSVAHKLRQGRTEVDARTLSPLRTASSPPFNHQRPHEVYRGGTLTLWNGGAQVAYRNRESRNAFVKDSALAGYYYVEVAMATQAKDPNFEAPFRLTVKVDGTPHGAPRYAASGNGDPVSQQDGAGTAPTTSAPSAPTRTSARSSASATATTVDGRQAAKEGPMGSSVAWIALGAGVLLVLGGGTAAALAFRRR